VKTEPLALPDAAWDEMVAAIEAEAERMATVPEDREDEQRGSP
jgi:hypothetical protein